MATQNNISTKQILQMVQSPSIDDLLQRKFAFDYDEYENNSHCTGNFNIAELEKLSNMMYVDWRNFMISHEHEFKDGLVKKVAHILSTHPKFNPTYINNNHKNPYPYLNFINQGFKKYFGGTDCEFAETQAYFTDEQANLGDGFLHVYGFNILGLQAHTPECRLYLNLMGENIAPFAIEAYNLCKQQNLPFYFKFTSGDHRNDTFLFYLTHEELPQYVQIIEQIKSNRPELFKGTDKVSNNMGIINGYIGYGDEPLVLDDNNENHSFNSLRDETTRLIYQIALREFKQKYPVTKSYQTISTLPGCRTLDECITMMANKFIQNKVTYPLNAEDIAKIQKQIRTNFYQMILSGKPMEDISFYSSQNHKGISLITSEVDWFAEIEKMIQKPFDTKTELRAYLSKFTTFGNTTLSNDQIQLRTAVHSHLIQGLQNHKSTTTEEENYRLAMLKKLYGPYANLDNLGQALVTLSTANFINKRHLTAYSKKIDFTFDEFNYSVFKSALGNNVMMAITNEVCVDRKISAEHSCFNDETVQKFSIPSTPVPSNRG